jgi:hypothetical protein
MENVGVTGGETMTDKPRVAPPRQKVRVGQGVTVKREMFTRSGEHGTVVAVYEKGCAVDFFDNHLPTIEFWEYKELDI